jgi:O-antigen/teichoic acid export membrane protein
VSSEIDAQTELGEVYVRSLVRSQLRLAVEVVVGVALTLGMLPVLFAAVPESRSIHVLGLPLPWLLLGLVVYPFLVTLGWVYVRRAERNERAFSDLVDRA